MVRRNLVKVRNLHQRQAPKAQSLELDSAQTLYFIEKTRRLLVRRKSLGPDKSYNKEAASTVTQDTNPWWSDTHASCLLLLVLLRSPSLEQRVYHHVHPLIIMPDPIRASCAGPFERTFVF
jgi:hypothetical protein